MKISQREARRLRKRVDELERMFYNQRSMWSQEYVGGVNIVTETWDRNHEVIVAIRTARKLGHAVVAVGNETGQILFMALPLA